MQKKVQHTQFNFERGIMYFQPLARLGNAAKLDKFFFQIVAFPFQNLTGIYAND